MFRATEEGDAVVFMVWIPVPSESYLGRLFLPCHGLVSLVVLFLRGVHFYPL